jgi:lipopolysaccharide transport system ATP-binding protein
MKLSLQNLYRLFKKQRTVAVLDDFFPNLVTAFRVAEYNWYLDCFPQLEIYSTNSDFKAVHAAYAQRYPEYADRVKQFDESSLDNCGFVYINFLNNVHYFLPSLYLHGIPFLMTLYPGGGFGLGDPESNAKLATIIESPLLCGIIATQSVTLDYLKEKNCRVPVYDIYGATLNPLYFESDIKKRSILLNSEEMSICFVADRYMPQGANKGYPQFIESAKQLIRKFPNLNFTVVGRFNPEDYPLHDQVRDRLSFKGLLITEKSVV